MADKLRKFRKDSYVEKRFGKDINVSTKEDAPLRKEMTATETKSVSKAQPSSGASPLSFSAAFAAARKDGDKTFTWKGKSYTTQLASEKKAAPARPAAKRDSGISRADAMANKGDYNFKKFGPQGIGDLRDGSPPKPASAVKAETPSLEGAFARAASKPKVTAAPKAPAKPIGGAASPRGIASFAAAAPKPTPKPAPKPAPKSEAKTAPKPASTGYSGRLAAPTKTNVPSPRLLAERKRGDNWNFTTQGRILQDIVKKAKGGSVRSVDGIAKRGKTRAPMKRK